MKKKEMSMKKQLAVYTLLFAVMATGALFVFWSNNRTILRYTSLFPDSLAQSYAFLAGFKNYLGTLLSGGGSNWSWNIGLGADAYSFYSSKLFNPLYWLAALAPKKYLDLSWIGMILAYLYLSGVTFTMFLRKVGIRDYRTVLGALCYVFTPWMILSAVKQGSFLLGAVMFPLLALCTEKILRRESPIPFALCVAFITLTSFRWPYTSGILIFFYYGFRYALDYREKGKKGAFAGRFATFLISGLVGILIAMPALLPTIMKLGKSTSVSGMKTPLLFSLGQYSLFPSRFTNWDAVYGDYSFSYVAMLPLCVVLVPAVVYHARKKRFPAVMSVLFTALSLIPAFGSLLNYFSYPNGRWHCILMFFGIWACMEALSDEVIGNKAVRKGMAVCFVLYTAYAMGYAGVFAGVLLGYVSNTEILLMAVNALFGAVFLALLFYRKDAKTGFLKEKKKQLALVGLTVVTGIACYNVYFSQYTSKDMAAFLENGESYAKFAASPQRVVGKIEDEGFWRQDQVEGVDVTTAPRNRINENVFFGNRSIYMFQSGNNSRWFEFGKFLGNNAIYFKRTCPNSNDNRMAADLLTGVKYFLGNQEGSRKQASRYAGYGFEPWKTIDGVEVLKNKYSIGIGTLYDSYISESELENMNYGEREQAMLQTIVLPDEEAWELAKENPGARRITEEELETNVAELSCRLKKGRNTKLDRKNKKITTSKKNGNLRLRIGEAKNCQLLVSFEGLKKLGKDGEEEFTVYIKKKGIKKAATDTIGSAQGFPDIDTLTVNLGYFEQVKGRLQVQLSSKKAGEYTYDNIKVYAVPVELYDRYAGLLQERSMKLEIFENDYIKGTVTADQTSVAFFSILNDSGWKVYVDGTKVSKVENTQLAFTGAVIPEGKHTIELRYHTPGLGAGILLGAFGIFCLFLLFFVWKKIKKI